MPSYTLSKSESIPAYVVSPPGLWPAQIWLWRELDESPCWVGTCERLSPVGPACLAGQRSSEIAKSDIPDARELIYNMSDDFPILYCIFFFFLYCIVFYLYCSFFSLHSDGQEGSGTTGTGSYEINSSPRRRQQTRRSFVSVIHVEQRGKRLSPKCGR